MSKTKNASFLLVGSDQPTTWHLCQFLNTLPDVQCRSEFLSEASKGNGVDVRSVSTAASNHSSKLVSGVCVSLDAFGHFKTTEGYNQNTSLVIVGRKPQDAYLADKGFLNGEGAPDEHRKKYFDITDYIHFEKDYIAHKNALQRFCRKSGLNTLELFHYELQREKAFTRILKQIGAGIPNEPLSVQDGIWGSPVYRELVANHDEFAEFFDARL